MFIFLRQIVNSVINICKSFVLKQKPKNNEQELATFKIARTPEKKIINPKEFSNTVNRPAYAWKLIDQYVRGDFRTYKDFEKQLAFQKTLHEANKKITLSAG